MKLKIFPEICCEVCNEVIHNHIDCPICENHRAATENYGELENDDILICERCGSEFKLLSKNWYDFDGCDVEIIKKGEIK